MVEEKLISQYNEAKLQIFRLHNIWLQARIYREAGKLEKLRWVLDSAKLELNTDAVRLDKEGSTFLSDLKAIEEEIKKTVDGKDPAQTYNKLIEKEIILRNIQEEAGKGGKLRYEDDEGM